MDDHAAQPPRPGSSERGQDGGSLETAQLQEEQVNAELPAVPLSQLAGSQATSSNGRNVVRPKTAPNARSSGIIDERLSFLDDEVKRDSGFAATSGNVPIDTNNNNNNSDAASPARGLAHTPSLPTIVVHDADSHRLHTLERIISPFTKKRHQETTSEPQRPATAHQRIKSFHGIETDIPLSLIHI